MPTSEDQSEKETPPADAPVHGATVALAIAELGLDQIELRKLDQYLDATKAGLLFGTRIVLVEGVSEAILIPVLGRQIYGAADDDAKARKRALAGLTIVNIGSVDFEPYVRLLLGADCSGHSILDRLVVITDSDPTVEDDEEPANEPATSDEPQPVPRVARLLALAAADPRLRVFTATWTLEADLLAESENEPVLREVFLAQKPRSAPTWQSFVDSPVPAEALYRRLRTSSKFISKGQFAHDLALRVSSGATFASPAYLADGIKAALGL